MRWGVLLVGLVVAIVAWILMRDSTTELGQPAARSVDVAAPAPADPEPLVTSNAALDIPTPCEGQPLEIDLGGQHTSACMGTTSIVQNGSVRTYRVDAIGGAAHWFRIDASGSKVLSAALGSAAGDEFRCKGSQCKGISIGRHDVQGVRTISLERATVGEQVTVSGTLHTIPEDEIASLACPEQGVRIVTSDSSAQSFCPKGGAGFEVANDGTRTFRFTNLDGESILVELDGEERVKRVAYEGDSTLACKRGECGRVAISPPGGEGERTVTFAGTTLLETTNGERNAVLNGTLVVPAL